ncbi:MAG: AzlD domain-containing protein, partial [Lachnospiraceae bacterium]|nr:AzlD domain-containing protein [Lachnospiraceae bacterium]
LAVMTFPEILHATMSPYSALLAFVVGIVLAFSGKTLPTIAAACCVVVFLSEWVLVR